MHEIEHLIDNLTFKNINQPVALYFSYVDADKFDYYEAHKQELIKLKNTCKDKLALF